MSEYTFKHPPAHQVTASLQFLNNLKVADERYPFHELIKAEFPIVVMPELKNLTYDFGDYSLYSQNLAFRLEISMNYFRLISSPYPGFAAFSQMFMGAFGLFSKFYEIDSFSSLTLHYSNKLPVDGNRPFGDYFAIEIKVPGVTSPVWGGQGTIGVQEEEGQTFIELQPEFDADGKALSYNMNLTFSATSSTKAHVESALRVAHQHLSRYFFSCLKPEYLKELSEK